MRALVVLVVVAACGRIGFDPSTSSGGDDDDGPTPTSGSRLKLEWYDFDGTRQIAGIYDTQLAKECLPIGTVDGMRCVPVRTLAIVGYLDAACTQPVGFDLSACTDLSPEYLLEIAPGCNAPVSRVFARGGSLGTGNVYVSADGSSCVGPFPMAERIALGAEVPLTDIAEITVGEPVGTDRLRGRGFESADGFRMPYLLYDTMLDADCAPDSTGSSTVCAPIDTMSSYFADTQCSMAFGATSSGCAAPAYVLRTDGECRSSGRHWYERGAAIASPSTKYTWSGATCTMTSTSADAAYELGSELSLPEISRTPSATGGRVRTYDGIGAVGFLGALFDTTLGVECHPQRSATGAAICVPAHQNSEQFFTDAQCMNGVDLVNGDAGCPGEVPAFATIEDSCARIESVHSVGAMTSGTIYLDSSGTCSSYSTADPFFRLGPALDLPTGTITIDP